MQSYKQKRKKESRGEEWKGTYSDFTSGRAPSVSLVTQQSPLREPCRELTRHAILKTSNLQGQSAQSQQTCTSPQLTQETHYTDGLLVCLHPCITDHLQQFIGFFVRQTNFKHNYFLLFGLKDSPVGGSTTIKWLRIFLV